MLRRIDRILLRVPNVASAVGFYHRTFGLSIVKEDARLAVLQFRNSDAELVLHNDPDLPAEGVYYLVDDVRAMFERRQELKLHFVSQPTRVSRGWRAAVRDPFGNTLLILDHTGEGQSVVEDAAPMTGLFAGVELRQPVRRDTLIALYEQIGRTADDLPYTPHFETLYEGYIAGQPDPVPTRQETWRHLLNIRKAGKLPRLGEARSPAPEVPAEDRARLRDILGKDIGKRDRLPYSPRFDEVTDAFNNGLPRPLSPHLIWRLVATLAK